VTRYFILIAAIIAPFLTYWIIYRLTNKVNKKFPLILLSSISLSLLILSLIYFRISESEPAGLKYTPPKYQDNKVVPSQIK